MEMTTTALPTNKLMTVAGAKMAIIRCECGKVLRFEKAAHSGQVVCGYCDKTHKIA